jgi:hypothetical protein
MATLPCLGFPSDSLGSNGDAAQDLQNRIIYFPKANGTWVGAPAYAFQGQVGPSLQYSNGTPSNSVGSPGQGIADLSTGNTYIKGSNNQWGSPVGKIVGAQGVAGPSGQSVPALNSVSTACGPMACNATALALSGTPQNIPAPGTTQPLYFVPQTATTFTGAILVLSSANTPGATTYNLVDVTANTTKWSYTISTYGTVVLPAANVALTPGNTHAWTVSGSGNAFVQATPFLQQASTVPMGINYLPLLGYNFTSAPTSSTVLVIPGGSQAAGVSSYLGIPKTGFLYGVTLYNPGNVSVTFTLNNSAGTQVWSATCSAGGGTILNFGPYTPTTATLPAGYYTWRVTSSSTGYFGAQAQVFA